MATTEHDSDYFPPFSAALEGGGDRLLWALETLTPAAYHMQQRDHADAGAIAEKAGLATVGQPDTRMAMAMRSLSKLAEAGFVEKVKTEETIRYRLSPLGEREVLHARLRAAERDRTQVERELAKAREDLVVRTAEWADELRAMDTKLTKTARELEQTRHELERARRPWYKRLKGDA